MTWWICIGLINVTELLESDVGSIHPIGFFKVKLDSLKDAEPSGPIVYQFPL
jgi:hypothetical protein